jgi:cytochrome P450
LTYKDSLSLILENAILIMLLGLRLLTGSLQRFLPKHWRLVGQATNTFKQHIAESIKEEKERMAEGKANRSNFISAMVRASEEEARTLDTSTGRPLHGLTETEIYGNIFVFNFAGHNSIAITLTYVITHLATHPKIQDWLAAEIRHVTKDQSATSYRDAFPKLKRCTAVVVSLP